MKSNGTEPLKGNTLKINLTKKPLDPAAAFDILMGGDKSGTKTRSMFEIFADELDETEQSSTENLNHTPIQNKSSTQTRSIFEIFADEMEGGGMDNPDGNNSKDSLSKNKEERKRESTDIVFLSPDKLIPHPDNFFRPHSGAKLQELADDIAMNGIISPIYVRPFNEGYQILAGHNRVSAAKLAGLSTVPCIIKDCDDDTAALIVVNSNLNQRENLLPSEKARAYKIQVEKLKKRGKSIENIESFSDDDKEYQEHSLLGNKTTMYRFIRLTYLVGELLQAVDDGKLAVFAGEDLSYLNANEQQAVHQYFFIDKRGALDIKAASRLRQRAQEVKLTYGEVERLMQKKPKPQVAKFTANDFKDYIPVDTPKKQYVEILREALKQYYPDLEQNKK